MFAIPFKITKRQCTTLNKKNFKWLKCEIDDQYSDLMIEATTLSESWDPDNKYMDKWLLEAPDTIKVYNKQVKVAFKDFIKTKRKILKAYQRGLKNAKSTKVR